MSGHSETEDSSAHAVITHRSNPYTPMSPRIKKWINWLRRVQLVLRVIELNGSLGILALMVLLTKMDPVKSWVMRIAVSLIWKSRRRMRPRLI